LDLGGRAVTGVDTAKEITEVRDGTEEQDGISSGLVLLAQ
jgi:hypothetical protein